MKGSWEIYCHPAMAAGIKGSLEVGGGGMNGCLEHPAVGVGVPTALCNGEACGARSDVIWPLFSQRPHPDLTQGEIGRGSEPGASDAESGSAPDPPVNTRASSGRAIVGSCTHTHSPRGAGTVRKRSGSTLLVMYGSVMLWFPESVTGATRESQFGGRRGTWELQTSTPCPHRR